MANTKISQAYSKPALEETDMIPVAAQGLLTPYHITGEALFDSMRPATTAEPGVVELATAAEAAAGTDTERALTPASLQNAIGPTMVAPFLHYIGTVDPVTGGNIYTTFNSVVGRNPNHGDLVVFDGPSSEFYFGLFHVPAGKFYCFNMRDGSFASFS
jgi:hypothetical protein